MNFEKALKAMCQGEGVESLVSNTTYKLDDMDDRLILCAEGEPVDFTYLTKEEIMGKFRVVHIKKGQDELNSLSDEDKERLMKETFNGIKNKRKFDKEVRNNQS